MTLIPKRTKDTNIATEIAQGKLLRQRIIKLADEAGERFMAGDNLNDVIAEIANRESFNRIQMQRLVEETNTTAFNKRYEVVRKDNDRRISFELANLDRIIEIMGATAPPEVSNPNWVTGEAGEGKMDKAAGVTYPTLFNANTKVDDMRSRMMEKKASAQERTNLATLAKSQRIMDSCIFKIANSLVMTEKLYKKGNVVFNTLLEDSPLDTGMIEDIQKMASEITKGLINTRRAHPSFVTEFKVDHTEKTASLLLGEYSFLKTAAEHTMVAPPKVNPTSDVSTYQQLVDLANQLRMEQTHALALQNPANQEVL
jgi:hypothetical protein